MFYRVHSSNRHIEVTIDKVKKALGKKRCAVIEEICLETDGLEIVMPENMKDSNGASLTIIEVGDCNSFKEVIDYAKEFIDEALDYEKINSHFNATLS